MPTLELAPGDINNPVALDYVAALMIWPHDKAQQRRAQEAALADRMARWMDSVAPDAVVEVGAVAQYMRWTITAPRLSDVLIKAGQRHPSARTPNPFRDGAMAGTILYDFLGRRALGHPAPIDLVKGQVAHRFRMSKQHVENRVWKHFRCVAHLWAAWIIFAVKSRDEGINSGFPCRLADFPDFLALAERNRIEGESAEFLQSAKGTVLKPGETWRVPSELRLPEIGVETVKKLSNPH